MYKNKPFALAKRNYYPLIFILGFLSLIFVIQIVIPEIKQAETYLPALAIAAGFAYFLYTKHHQETKLFNELFRQFNAKYDSINEVLNKIANENQVTILEAQDKQVLFDYFNLCAEEYLYFKTGYIDLEVWNSWSKGMSYFASVTHIRELWIKELANGSYYGFSLELLSKEN